MEQAEPQDKPKHPGWKSLADVLDKKGPLFDQSLFLEGFEFSANIYVIGGDYVTVVDPGNDYTAYMELFSRLDYAPTDIKKVVFTHGHHDHSMGIFELLRSYPSILQDEGVELLMHEASPPQLKRTPQEVGARVTELLGGETLDLSGLEWEVLHTPGHTIDGICLYHAPTKTAITGDMVMPHAMAEPDPFAGGSLDHYLYSLRSLLKRDIENILPGHGGPVGVGARKVVEETYEGVILKYLEKELEIDPNTPWGGKASALAERGLLEESVYCCNKELDEHPDKPEALELKALCLNDLGRCSEAIDILDTILAKQSDNAFALTGKGYGLLGLGRHEEAIPYLDKALAINPDIKEAKVYKGMALYLAGRYTEAMDIDEFQTEFLDRFKDELEKKGQPPPPPNDQ